MKKGDRVQTKNTPIEFRGEVIEIIAPESKYDVTVARVKTSKGVVVRANIDYLEEADNG